MATFCLSLVPGFDSDEGLRAFGFYLAIVPVVLLLLKAFVPWMSPPVFVLFLWVAAFVIAAVALFRAEPDGTLDHDNKWMLISGAITFTFGAMVWAMRRLWVARMSGDAGTSGSGGESRGYRWAKILL